MKKQVIVFLLTVLATVPAFANTFYDAQCELAQKYYNRVSIYPANNDNIQWVIGDLLSMSAVGDDHIKRDAVAVVFPEAMYLLADVRKDNQLGMSHVGQIVTKFCNK